MAKNTSITLGNHFEQLITQQMGIWAHTRAEWSDRKADDYLASLRQCLDTLAAWPEGGSDCGYIRNGYRKYPCHRHVIFHRPAAAGVEVVRVLHESMDVGSCL